MRAPRSCRSNPSGKSSVPAVHFDTDAFEGFERMDALRTFTSGLLQIDPLRDAHAFRDLQSAWRTPEFLATSFFRDAASVTYGPLFLRHTVAFRRVIVRMYRRGRFCVIKRDKVFENRPGFIYLSDAYTGIYTEATEGVTLTLDTAACGIAPDGPFHVAIPIESALGRVIAATLEAMFAALPDCTIHEAQGIARATAALVGEAFGFEGDADARKSRTAARALAIKRFVEQRLTDPSLSIALIQRTFATSRATIYRAFETEGGFDHFVAARRMHSALVALAASGRERGAVRNVAASFGYDDPVQFNRLFRRHIGVAPSDVLGAQRGEQSDRIENLSPSKVSLRPWRLLYSDRTPSI